MTSQQSVLACSGSSLHVKQPVCAVFESNKVKSEVANTEAEIGQVLLWSYKALETGKWPHTDYRGRAWPAGSAEAQLAGQDLAGGYRGVVFISKADLDFVAKSLGLRHYGANQPCDFCPCDRSSAEQGWWPTNFGRTSLWKNALYTAEEWRALYPAVPHWLFSLDHFCQYNVEPDELHIVWLGTAMYCNGSVLWLLVFRILPDSPTKNMENLWADIVDCYRELGISTQYTNLSIGSFCDVLKPSGHYPKLKAGTLTEHRISNLKPYPPTKACP